MDIILNEKEMAEHSIETGYISKKPTDTIRILIKYYHSIGKDKISIFNEVVAFLNEYQNDFVLMKWLDTLDKMIKTYANDKYKLVLEDSVSITQNELNYIKSINNLKLERLAFVLLIYCKIQNQINPNNNNWVKRKISELFKDSKIVERSNLQRLTLHKLITIGAIKTAKAVDNTGIQLEFIDESSEVVMVISDFREVVLEYLKFKGEKIKCCKECGIRFKLRSANSNAKYCIKCAKEVKARQDKIRKYGKNEDAENVKQL